MSNIVLVMYRRAIAQGLIIKLRDSEDVKIIYEPEYNNANITIRNNNAKAVLIEAAESGPYNMDYCLKLCKNLRKQVPECKLLLMCSEQDENCVKQVVEAKEKKQIDDFVFYDVTIDYLISKLISI